MRIHGLITVLALLIIAAGFVPQFMGDIGTLTGEYTGVMLADELGTIGDDFDLFFKDGLMTDTLVLEYYDGTEYVTVADEVAQQFYSYYLLNNDNSQKLYLDGSFDDGVFADLSGNGNHGTPYNGATTGTGVVGDGISFDGVDDYVIFSNITITGEWSVIVWDNPVSFPSGECRFLGKNSYNNIFHIRRNGYYYYSYRGENYTYYTFLTSDTSGYAGTYNAVAFIHDGSDLSLYDNGIYMEKIVSVDNRLDVNRIGSGYINTFDYAHNMDEIRIYDRALTANEVEVLNDVPLQMQSWNGYDLYASYEYRDTFAPIATDLFTVGFPVLGIVILVFVGASYLYNN